MRNENRCHQKLCNSFVFPAALRLNFKVLKFKFFFADSQAVVNGAKDVQTSPQINNQQIPQNSDNNNHLTIQNFSFSRKNLILMLLTILCAILGIVLLTVYLIYGNQLQNKQQGDYRERLGLSDGDDSRKNIPINSTIGKLKLEGFDSANNQFCNFRQ